MKFYQQCLGGELTFQTVGESPLSEKMPRKMKNCILHATLTKDNFVLMGSDMVSDKGLSKGNTISLSLHCNSEEEIKNCYAKLSKEGLQNQPLEDSFWGALFGDLTDKFGNHWILSFNKISNN
jgi:PhnB protein